jgi:hypothetical protein
VFSRTNSTKSLASGEGKVNEPRPMSQVEKVRKFVCALNLCVSAIGAVEVPVFLCVCSTCNHVTEVGGALKFVRLSLKVVTQNDGEFDDMIML